MKRSGFWLRRSAVKRMSNAREATDAAMYHTDNSDAALAKMCIRSAINHLNLAAKRLNASEERGRPT